MKIVNMNKISKEQINQAARILTESIPEGWPDFQSAMKEIQERLVPENTILVAIENDEVIGWGGMLKPVYNGNVFELHPLAVRKDMRRKGVGRAIVKALEDAARDKGGLIIYVGADDEREGGETSLAYADLFHNLPEKLAEFKPGTHQTGFYMKLGYKIIGVMPDANGIGKPDIFLAKRL
ncbi:GNAT family N-acetyltransferase [Anaeropeptidivorans aminofermentans]|jgi:aminoglycoside 6'-N-acetyltransferase I|uniref:GNAT family N-acetyltransferase n=1 Tax=Anaeropeptidivorans aminofermentans TaxID=2934315 RepID=UPI002024DD79|nr:GNAT family N-acetyltransferase [Anaeropeptidivorans aminofermentans]